jgi:hypothetical protein
MAADFDDIVARLEALERVVAYLAQTGIVCTTYESCTPQTSGQCISCLVCRLGDKG